MKKRYDRQNFVTEQMQEEDEDGARNTPLLKRGKKEKKKDYKSANYNIYNMALILMFKRELSYSKNTFGIKKNKKLQWI